MANSNNNINININAKDNASPKIKQVNVNLRELGEKIRGLGMMTTAALTLPIVGGLALIGRSGAEAAKQVNELQAELRDAIAAKDLKKVEELNKQLEALPKNITRSAKAWNEMQAALAPANEAFAEAKSILLEALVPVLRDIAPLIIGTAANIRDLAQWFHDLPGGVRTAIAGVVLFIAAIGPVIGIVGQVIYVIGTLQGIAAGLGAILPGVSGAITVFSGALKGAAAMAGPIGLLAASLGLLLVVLEKYGPRAWNTIKMLDVLATRAVFGNAKAAVVFNQNFPGNARGGNVLKGRPSIVGENGPEIFNPTMNGTIIPNHQIAGVGGGGGVTIVYSPTISTASPDEIEKFGKYVRQAIRRSP